jgi:Flp pilus assembly protein TadB
MIAMTSDRAEQPAASAPAQRDDPLGDLLSPTPAERSIVRRAWLIALGCTLFLLGIVFWLTPVMTGIPFWLAGLVCLAKVSDRIRRVVNAGDRILPNRLRKMLRWARDKTARRKDDAPAGTAPVAPEP